jgi:hypothetical protein
MELFVPGRVFFDRAFRGGFVFLPRCRRAGEKYQNCGKNGGNHGSFLSRHMNFP